MQPDNRPLALLYARYLLFMDAAPEARDVLEKIHPASGGDAAWLLTMANACVQLGDLTQARLYTERVNEALWQDTALALAAPVPALAVGGYRAYEVDPRREFSPGALINFYVEISGAQFQTHGNAWQCALTFAWELRDRNGNLVAQEPHYGRYDPTFTGAVRDLHATLAFSVPETLASATYTLRFFCEDENGGQKCQVDYALTIGNRGASIARNGSGAGVAPELRREAEPLTGGAATFYQGERKIADAEGLLKALETNLDPLLLLNETEGDDKSQRIDRILRGMEMRREQSKMHGDLLSK
jgi:hypothetical protein